MMILDGENLGIGGIEISEYNFFSYEQEKTGNVIDIYSKDNSCMFSFYTTIECKDFNKLELNKKTNMITGKYDFIDEDDLCVVIKDAQYILTSYEVSMFITKISNNEFVIDFETLNLLERELINTNSSDCSYKTLKIHTNINFNNIIAC